jgi:hypothetical protein
MIIKLNHFGRTGRKWWDRMFLCGKSCLFGDCLEFACCLSHNSYVIYGRVIKYLRSSMSLIDVLILAYARQVSLY